MVELPKYSGSWDTVDSQESADEKIKDKGLGKGDEKAAGVTRVREKELPALPEDAREDGVKANSYYDDASDEEEAREAKATEVRYVGVARPSSKRIEYSRKMS
jgi:hypothetical protein